MQEAFVECLVIYATGRIKLVNIVVRDLTLIAFRIYECKFRRGLGEVNEPIRPVPEDPPALGLFRLHLSSESVG
ncbi:unnamed protein product [Calicophoron daubneyi]|uniref:Uncharacterized protein n=1 Tax=Calicophoron daubneyi TaxID=300641 RepID=A0AAV2TXX8_CALDB